MLGQRSRGLLPDPSKNPRQVRRLAYPLASARRSTRGGGEFAIAGAPASPRVGPKKLEDILDRHRGVRFLPQHDWPRALSSTLWSSRVRRDGGISRVLQIAGSLLRAAPLRASRSEHDAQPPRDGRSAELRGYNAIVYHVVRGSRCLALRNQRRFSSKSWSTDCGGISSIEFGVLDRSLAWPRAQRATTSAECARLCVAEPTQAPRRPFQHARRRLGVFTARSAFHSRSGPLPRVPRGHDVVCIGRRPRRRRLCRPELAA